MNTYGVRDVERLLHLSRGTLRALVSAGFVLPARGPRNAWRFSFRDLIVLRTAQALTAARIPRKRITTAVKALRRRLPEAMPLSGLSICAEAGRVVVKEGSRRWQADSGQYLLAFEGDPAEGSLSIIERDSPPQLESAGEWFERGVALEPQDRDAAVAAYERALAADPAYLDAAINLGRLLHEGGEWARAERVYRERLNNAGGHPMLLYNLGVLLDDMSRKSEALEVYAAALRADPGFADCHYNVALLCEQLGRRSAAIRHMAQYRRLTAGKRP